MECSQTKTFLPNRSNFLIFFLRFQTFLATQITPKHTSYYGYTSQTSTFHTLWLMFSFVVWLKQIHPLNPNEKKPFNISQQKDDRNSTVCHSSASNSFLTPKEEIVAQDPSDFMLILYWHHRIPNIFCFISLSLAHSCTKILVIFQKFGSNLQMITFNSENRLWWMMLNFKYSELKQWFWRDMFSKLGTCFSNFPNITLF